MNESPVSDLLRKAIIKTENQLMHFSDSIWQDTNIRFYQGGPIDHGTHVPGPVDQ